MNLARRSRIYLIRIGKMLPFVVCFLCAITFGETLYSLYYENFAVVDGLYIPINRISWLIGNVFEYNYQFVVLLAVLSVSIQTCVWNKLCVAYLAVQLAEKEYFIKVELYPETIALIAFANLFICAFFIYKGFKTLITK